MPQSWISGDIFTKPRGHRTLHAWEPWDFSVEILFNFQHLDIGKEYPEWRLYWFSGVAVLRTIGHVLNNVDTQISLQHRECINEAWLDWNNNKDDNWIFFDFIERERNSILKEFSFGAELPSIEDGRELIYRNSEHDAGQLLREAVYWWRDRLEKIEECIATRNQSINSG